MQEKHMMHTYHLIEAKIFHGSEKIKQRENRNYHMFSLGANILGCSVMFPLEFSDLAAFSQIRQFR